MLLSCTLKMSKTAKLYAISVPKKKKKLKSSKLIWRQPKKMEDIDQE